MTNGNKKNMTLTVLVDGLYKSVNSLMIRSLKEIKGKLTPETTLKDLVYKENHPETKELLNQAMLDILEYSGLMVESPRYQKLPSEIKADLGPKIESLRSLATKLPLSATLNGDLPEMGHLAMYLNEKINLDRTSDGLTGLMGMDPFESLTQQKIIEYINNPERGISLVFIDLNDFKEYNDMAGHGQADAVLKAFASKLNDIPEIIPARRSGDEFLMLAPDRDADGAVIASTLLIPSMASDFAEKIKEKLGEMNLNYNPAFENAGHRISFSAGVSSTHLPNSLPGRGFYARLDRYVGKWYKTNKSKLAEVDVGQMIELFKNIDNKKYEPGSMVHRFKTALRSTENWSYFVDLFYTMLVDEAEKAMHLAKKTREPNESRICVYNPALNRNDYAYTRK